jgi:biopolymer transport protein ExbD
MERTESLSAAQHAKIRRLSKPAEAAPGDEAGELNVVPFLDILMNVMMFVLASVSVAFVSSIPTSAAMAGPTSSVRPPEGLELAALVTSQGVALKTKGGAISPGCGGMGGGITIPMRDGAHDFTALTECARRIKGSRPDLVDETHVKVSASPDVAYETLVSVMDALRRDEHGALFPDVGLGVVR